MKHKGQKDNHNPAAETATPKIAGAGLAALRQGLKTLPAKPGVYRMLNGKGEALYVGKAKNLAKRVASYTQVGRLPNRLQRMVAETRALEIITTHTEVEALLLESNLIKQLKPRFNVLLRDDKSFPSILLTRDHDFPQLTKHRGAPTRKGDYFGPFASGHAVSETLTILERAFLLRSCPDSVFSNRRRPCLLFQIKRCSAPCVGTISKAHYALLVKDAKAFLSGKSHDVQKGLAGKMQDASRARDFEQAALYRDRIRALSQIQARQDINIRNLGDADVFAACQNGGETGIQVFFFRAGRNYGNRAYYPKHERETPLEEVMGGFLGQFYESRTAPRNVLVSHALAEEKLMAAALTQRAGHKVTVLRPTRGAKRKVVDHALANAREALARKLSQSASQQRLLAALAESLDLDHPPARIEVYDNSHIQGAQSVGAMIVADSEGFVKKAYRKFNIRGEDATPGDDYAMMREVLTRRFSRALKEDPEHGTPQWPDLVLIDGGAGHLHAAQAVLADLGLSHIPLLAIAKGPERNAGRETFHREGRAPFSLEPRDPVLYFLQRLRDEAHRFAIGAHRSRRSRLLGRSELDAISGIGAARKKALLLRFGSARGVAEAGLADLEGVAGISKAVARRIYDHFHENG